MKAIFRISLLAIATSFFTMCSKSEKSTTTDTATSGSETYKFYRVKQVDKNGKISYSVVKRVKR